MDAVQGDLRAQSTLSSVGLNELDRDARIEVGWLGTGHTFQDVCWRPNEVLASVSRRREDKQGAGQL